MEYFNQADYAWLGLGDVNKLDIKNPLDNLSKFWDNQTPPAELHLMTQPEYISMAAKVLLNVNLLPMQAAILKELWLRRFPMFIASRGYGKTWSMAVLAMLKLVLVPGTKIVIVGAAFRQSKVMFEYMEGIWRNAPILRSVCDKQTSGPSRDVDRWTMRVNDSWAVAIPLGNGEKIRGLRAHTVIIEEFNSVPPDIYETVVAGFAAVSADPLGNVKNEARREFLIDNDAWDAGAERVHEASKANNQIIISGTAGYDFQHYADYWKKYSTYIKSKGEPDKQIKLSTGEGTSLRQCFSDGVVPDDFDHRDYSITRIPFKLIPKGFMDHAIVARAKATMHSGIYQMEYAACFSSDSNGFFKRSLIESCVTNDQNPINLPSGPVWFNAATRGMAGKKYVFGIDPASETDNFALVLLEMWPDHNRVVYSWTTNRHKFKMAQKSGLTREYDYYKFCVRKVRDLMKRFTTERIGMDAQGGGIAIEEGLHDLEKLLPGELPIWLVIDPDKPDDSDGYPGLHILEMIQFARSDWTSEANHGMRKDFEDKVLLFPQFDPVVLALAIEDDKARQRANKKANIVVDEAISYDSLEDVVMEIEELKNELATIMMTMTGTGVGGRERWDTPEVKSKEGKKSRLRKDRYSALVIANMIARQLHRAVPAPSYDAIGDFTHNIEGGADGPLYTGPEWFTDAMNNNDVIFGVNKQK